jgi:hypothetical protein
MFLTSPGCPERFKSALIVPRHGYIAIRHARVAIEKKSIYANLEHRL